MAYRLRHGIDIAAVGRELRGVATDARTVGSGGGDFQERKRSYLTWLGRAEVTLRNTFTDESTWDALYDECWWEVQRQLTIHGPNRLITDQCGRWAERFEAMAGQLDALGIRLSAAPGTFAVLDTNVLLHYLPPDQIDWTAELDGQAVRVLVPLRVLQELDEKKWTARDDLADRARRLLSQLRSILAPNQASAPVPLRSNVTLEIHTNEEPRPRLLDADQEVLDVCSELQALGASVILVTGDTGMTVRAWSSGLCTMTLPDKYLRRRQTADGAVPSGDAEGARPSDLP